MCMAAHCYVRRTLVHRSKQNHSVSREALTKRRNVLDSTKETKIKCRVFQGSQAECLWTQVYAGLHRTRIENIVQAADYLYYGTCKHRTP